MIDRAILSCASVDPEYVIPEAPIWSDSYITLRSVENRFLAEVHGAGPKLTLSHSRSVNPKLSYELWKIERLAADRKVSDGQIQSGDTVCIRGNTNGFYLNSTDKAPRTVSRPGHDLGEMWKVTKAEGSGPIVCGDRVVIKSCHNYNQYLYSVSGLDDPLFDAKRDAGSVWQIETLRGRL